MLDESQGSAVDVSDAIVAFCWRHLGLYEGHGPFLLVAFSMSRNSLRRTHTHQ